MVIYIASSWKNQHGVEMLTALLRKEGHEVISWVENNYGENHNHVTKKFSFEEWVNSDEANQSFEFDTKGATTSDVVIYYSPSGKDAAVEVGMAWAKGIPIIGLFAKGEDLGLMRKIMHCWCQRYEEVIATVEELKSLIVKNPYACFGNKRPHPMDFDTDLEYRNRIENWLKWEEENIVKAF